MLRVVRWVGPLGVAAIVLGFSKLHASRANPPYDFTASTRFPWALTFIAATLVGGYALGLPDLVRTRRASMVREGSPEKALASHQLMRQENEWK